MGFTLPSQSVVILQSEKGRGLQVESDYDRGGKGMDVTAKGKIPDGLKIPLEPPARNYFVDLWDRGYPRLVIEAERR